MSMGMVYVTWGMTGVWCMMVDAICIPILIHELTSGLVDLDHTTLNHLVVQIVTLSGALAHTSKNRVPSVVHGDVVDQLLCMGMVYGVSENSL